MPVLKIPTPEDAEQLVEAVHESLEDLHPWMPWATNHYSLDDARKWIEGTVANRDAGTAHEFFVCEDGRHLGTCGVNRIDEANRQANLGYWIRSSQAGRGLAAEVVQLLVNWVTSNTELCRLEIVVAVGNNRSLRVAEKAGAQREGILRSRLWLHGRPHDAAMHSIVIARPHLCPDLVEAGA